MSGWLKIEERALWTILCVVVGLYVVAYGVTGAYGQPPPPPRPPAAAGNPPAAFFGEGTAKPKAERLLGRRRELSILEARRMGLTFSSIRQACEELKAQGVIDEESSNAEVAALVTAHILERQDVQQLQAREIDWDAVLRFVEALIPIILRLIGLFGG